MVFFLTSMVLFLGTVDSLKSYSVSSNNVFNVLEICSESSHTSSNALSVRHFDSVVIVDVAVPLALTMSIFSPCRYLLKLSVFERMILSTSKSKSHIAVNKHLLSTDVFKSFSSARRRSALTRKLFHNSLDSLHDHLVMLWDLSVSSKDVPSCLMLWRTAWHFGLASKKL